MAQATRSVQRVKETKNKLATYPAHLGLGATVVVEPEFTGDINWYGGYGERHGADDGVEGRLVSQHTFAESWDVWEMHPRGEELVLCTEGTIDLIQQHDDGTETKIQLQSGEYAINPRGVWHTADVTRSATAVFITAGEGTEHKPR